MNDRGKDLTRLEKVKSLAMEVDQNAGAIQAVALNQHFGEIYRSIDQVGSLLDEDKFIRHLSIVLWEPQGDRFHDASMDRIYMQYRDHDVGNTQDLGLLRKYVYLRQLRLAAFAAQRF